MFSYGKILLLAIRHVPISMSASALKNTHEHARQDGATGSDCSSPDRIINFHYQLMQEINFSNG
jgi:hypothetical protein